MPGQPDIVTLVLDVPSATGLGPTLEVGCTLAVPSASAEAPLVFCVHGGTYTRQYWHPRTPRLTGYSFLEAMAARGIAAAAVDILGVGDSTKPADGAAVTPDAAVGAANGALRVLRDRLEAGDVPGTGKPLRLSSCALVGHSLGGMLVIAQQANGAGADGVAVLGWSNIRIDRGPDVQVRSIDEVEAPDGYVRISREGRRRLFHADDVPDWVATEDAATLAAAVPLGLYGATLTPGIVAEEAGRLDVPVYLLFGERDTSPDPAGEVAFYAGSPDITLRRLAGSAHCHNFASTRTVLWDKLSSWVRALPDRPDPNKEES